MLENARRQLFLVLLTIVAGLACIFTLKIPLGPDLKGGTQVRYEVPRDVLDSLVKKENITVDEVMAQTLGVIVERIDPSGALDPLVTRSGDNGILIELPYFRDPLDLKRVLERIANLGNLEMRIVAESSYSRDQISFDLPTEKRQLETWLAKDGNREKMLKEPLSIRRFNEDPVDGPKQIGRLAWYPHLVKAKPGKTLVWDQTFDKIPLLAPATVKVYTDAEWNNGMVPESMSKVAEKDRFLLEYVALNMDERAFTGKDLNPAAVSAGNGRDGGLAVNYAVNDALTTDYADWSYKYTGKCSAIVLNGIVKSAPSFQGKIAGSGQIYGDFTKEEVDELVKVLRTGSLRVEPELLSKSIIGPSLGSAAIERGVYSLLAGSVLVFAFMLVYYGVAGTIACITLLLNMYLLFAAMLFMQATITLPGLGGIVLTMGMAVDANVLIYERIREELAKGKDLLRSVRAGFERAMAAILDSNITTFLAGLVLFNVGSGPVRGFAVTLMVGIVTTVFTQFFVTRLLFHYAVEKKWLENYKPRSWFTNLNVDFVKYVGVCLGASIVLITAGLAFSLFAVPRETMLGIDFTGGANLRMVTAQALTADEVRDKLAGDPQFEAAYPNVTVNTVGEAEAGERFSQFNVRLKLKDAQRAQIELDRKEWRRIRDAASEAGTQPPTAYEPPYVHELRRIFGQQLVPPAFSDTLNTPNEGENKAMQYSQVALHFQKPIPVDAATKAFTEHLKGSKVTVLGDAAAAQAKDFRVEWMTQKTTNAWELPEIAREAVEELTDESGKKVTLSDPFPEAQEIHGRLVNDLRNAAIGAIIISWALIVLYLRVRFHEYKYGLAAVVALVHDVLVAFVVVVICNYFGLVRAEINMAMIACFLTIIGYSVNDTIVIFDRIRENLNDNARLGVVEPFRVLINRALNQTMSRTILTSGLTMLVVLAQFLVNYGSDSDLESFAFAMLIGMISGVYSTVYIAAPILIWMHKETAPAAGVPAAVTTAPVPTPGT